MPLPIVLLLLLCLCGSSIVGFWLRRALDDRHFTHDTLDSMRLVITMLVTFAALVLGLLTSSAKSRFDNQVDVLRSYGISLIELDQRLREYGPDADPIRTLLRSYTAGAIFDTWPAEPRPSGSYPVITHRSEDELIENAALGDILNKVDRMIEELTPVIFSAIK